MLGAARSAPLHAIDLGEVAFDDGPAEAAVKAPKVADHRR